LKRKILIFTDWYKPGYKAGGTTRSTSNMVDYLSDSLAIYIITRNTDHLDTIAYTSVKSNQWNKVDGATIYYLSKENITLKNIKKLTQEVSPDFIYCNSLYSLFFTLIPLYFAKKLKIKSILAICGMLSQGSLGVKSHKKKFFIFLSKVLGIFNKCTFHASNNNEKDDVINAFGSKSNIIIAQDLPEKKTISYQKKKKNNNQLKLVSVGRIAPEKNTLYALEVLKEVKTKITFDIYGSIYNQEYWQKCLAVINQLPSNIVVNYMDILNYKKIDETLKNYHVLFLPSTGENFGHVIIEAMINSCIPLISDKTPWKNLEEKKIGFDITLRKKEIFAEKIDFLALLNENDFNTMTANSYQYAHQVIYNNKSVNAYYKMFQLSH